MVKNNIDPKSSMTGSDPVQDAILSAVSTPQTKDGTNDDIW
jgi:hypothetical protein